MVNSSLRTGWLLSLLLFLGGCSTPQTRVPLQEDEQILAAVMLSAFKTADAGKIIVSLPNTQSEENVLHHVNALSPALRFALRPEKELYLGWVYSYSNPEHFYPGYAYVQVGQYLALNGRGSDHGHVLRQVDGRWAVVSNYTFEQHHKLDLQEYIAREILGKRS